MGAQFKFDRFIVDGSQRQLKCDGSVLEVNSRYLDALLLMVRNPGELITRDRFLTAIRESAGDKIITAQLELGDAVAQEKLAEK